MLQPWWVAGAARAEGLRQVLELRRRRRRALERDGEGARVREGYLRHAQRE